MCQGRVLRYILILLFYTTVLLLSLRSVCGADKMHLRENPDLLFYCCCAVITNK